MGQSITKEMSVQKSFDAVSCRSEEDWKKFLSISEYIIEEVPWAGFDKLSVHKSSDKLEVNIDLVDELDEENIEYHIMMCLKKVDNLPFDNVNFIINFVDDNVLIDNFFCTVSCAVKNYFFICPFQITP